MWCPSGFKPMAHVISVVYHLDFLLYNSNVELYAVDQVLIFIE